MARRKNPPEAVRMKSVLADRLRTTRVEIFGERGGPELARRLRLPIRTWYNYEAGVTIPGEVLLRFIEQTNVNPMWLLYGAGPQFLIPIETAEDDEGRAGYRSYVRSLLEAALRQLSQQRNEMLPVVDETPPWNGIHDPADPLNSAGADRPFSGAPPNHSGSHAIRVENEEESERGYLVVEDGSMDPIVPPGSLVAYINRPESSAALDGALVVIWNDEDVPVIRWYQHADQFALLRVESSWNDSEHTPEPIRLSEDQRRSRIRRVLWITARH